MAILTKPDPSDLRAFVAAYGGARLTGFEGLAAGTVNTSYAVELDGARHFLRIYEEQGAEGAAREARILAHLASSGVPTPVPLAADDGARVRTLAGKPAALFPWVSGGMLCTRSVSPAHAEVLGAALARVHLAGLPDGVALGPGRFTPEAIAARTARIASSRDPEARLEAGALRDAVLAASARREERARRGGAPSAGFIHGDLFRDNVLWADGEERSSIAALLDFESACEGPFVFDLAVTLLSWSFRDTFELPVARALVAGYQRVRPLGAAERDAFFDEAVWACLRFTVTRITDDAIRVGKRWQRFVDRRRALLALGPEGTREAFAL